MRTEGEDVHYEDVHYEGEDVHHEGVRWEQIGVNIIC